MKAIRLLMTVAAVGVLLVAMAPDASAQCPNARIFRSGAMDGSSPNFRLSPGYAGQAPGNEIGRFWQSSNALAANNGLSGPNFGTLCAPSLWWSTNATGNFQIDGALTVGACAQLGCPAPEMTLVVEDYGPTGPPGIGDTAYFAGFRVDETPQDVRWYNYGRAGQGAALKPFTEFPKVFLLNSDRIGLNVDINYDLASMNPNVYTAFGAASVELPATSVVVEYHLMMFTGVADPGRLRSAGWSTIETVSVVDGSAVSDFQSVPCVDVATDSWLAIGLGFEGGLGGIVDSALVGQAIQLECDPALADPNRPTGTLERKPETTQQPREIRGRR